MKPKLFAADAAFWSSGLGTWGWIIFGLGQLLFAQAYLPWSLVMVGVAIVAIHGLFAHSDEARANSAAGLSRGSAEAAQGERPSDVADIRARRAA